MMNIKDFIGGQVSTFKETFYSSEQRIPTQTIIKTHATLPTSSIETQRPIGFISGQTQRFREWATKSGRQQKIIRERDLALNRLSSEIDTQEIKLKEFDQYISEDKMFTGSNAQYQRYTRTFNKYDSNVKQHNKLVEEHNRYSEQQVEKRKAQFMGVRGKAEGLYERGEKWVSGKVHKVLPAWDERVKTQFYKPYETWSPGEKEILAGMDPLTQYLAKSPTYYKFRTGISDPMFGFYKETRERPLRQMLTTGAFIALPPVLKGLGKVGKVSGLAPRTVGGFLPKWTRHAPKAAAYGLGALYTGSIGYELYKTPAALRGEQFGRIAARDIVPMTVGTYVGIKGVPIFAKEAKLFPSELRRMLISREARIDPMRALRKKWALEQAGTEAKFLSGEWKPIETRGGIMVQKMIPSLIGRAKVRVGHKGGIGHKRPRPQTVTTTKVKQRAAGRAAKRRARHRKDTKKSEGALRAIEQERARMRMEQKGYLYKEPVVPGYLFKQPVKSKYLYKQIAPPVIKSAAKQKLLLGQVPGFITPSKFKFYPVVASISLLKQDEKALQKEMSITGQKQKFLEDLLSKEAYKQKEQEKYRFRFMPFEQYVTKQKAPTKKKARKIYRERGKKKGKKRPIRSFRERTPRPFVVPIPKKKKKLTKAQLRKLRQTLVLNPIKTPMEVLQWKL